MCMEDKFRNTLESLVEVPFEISDTDPLHILVKKTDLTRSYGSNQIVESLRHKFPWAMVYEETATDIRITLC